MNTNEIVKRLDIEINKEDYNSISKKLKVFTDALKQIISKKKIKADVFIGGSFAKKTVVKRNELEIDIFIRFFESEKDISIILEKIANELKNKYKKIEKIHGSRDYFRIKEDKLTYEIIPVRKIRNANEAENITDLSYFHVNFVRNKINNNISKEILIAKAFCKSCGVYGAESYIQGFSGYALECLMIEYKKFDKFLKEVIKNDKLVIDTKKYYKNKEEIMVLLNESKTKSPIILIDPTWKERNVMAALSDESYNKLKEKAKEYVKKPNIEYFIEKEFSEEDFKKRTKKEKSEYVKLVITTNKQPGDIAGTKMKKFFRFLSREIEKYYDIIDSEFIYPGKNSSELHISSRNKKDVIRNGPYNHDEKAVKAFKKANKNTFVKQNRIYAKITNNYSVRRFLKDWTKKYSKKARDMDITKIEIY